MEKNLKDSKRSYINYDIHRRLERKTFLRNKYLTEFKLTVVIENCQSLLLMFYYKRGFSSIKGKEKYYLGIFIFSEFSWIFV